MRTTVSMAVLICLILCSSSLGPLALGCSGRQRVLSPDSSHTYYSTTIMYFLDENLRPVVYTPTCYFVDLLSTTDVLINSSGRSVDVSITTRIYQNCFNVSGSQLIIRKRVINGSLGDVIEIRARYLSSCNSSFILRFEPEKVFLKYLYYNESYILVNMTLARLVIINSPLRRMPFNISRIQLLFLVDKHTKEAYFIDDGKIKPIGYLPLLPPGFTPLEYLRLIREKLIRQRSYIAENPWVIENLIAKARAAGNESRAWDVIERFARKYANGVFSRTYPYLNMKFSVGILGGIPGLYIHGRNKSGKTVYSTEMLVVNTSITHNYYLYREYFRPYLIEYYRTGDTGILKEAVEGLLHVDRLNVAAGPYILVSGLLPLEISCSSNYQNLIVLPLPSHVRRILHASYVLLSINLWEEPSDETFTIYYDPRLDLTGTYSPGEWRTVYSFVYGLWTDFLNEYINTLHSLMVYGVNVTRILLIYDREVERIDGFVKTCFGEQALEMVMGEAGFSATTTTTAGGATQTSYTPAASSCGGGSGGSWSNWCIAAVAAAAIVLPAIGFLLARRR